MPAAKMPAHDWFRPKLLALLGEAAEAGYARDVAEAVITDLMNGALSAAVPPPEENWAGDPGEPAGAAAEMPHAQSLPTEPFETGAILAQDLVPFRQPR